MKNKKQLKILSMHLEDIMDDIIKMEEYKKNLDKGNMLSDQQFIDLHISFDHIVSHADEGKKIIEKLGKM